MNEEHTEGGKKHTPKKERRRSILARGEGAGGLKDTSEHAHVHFGLFFCSFVCPLRPAHRNAFFCSMSLSAEPPTLDEGV